MASDRGLSRVPPEIQEKIRDLEQELNEGTCGWARRSGRCTLALCALARED